MLRVDVFIDSFFVCQCDISGSAVPKHSPPSPESKKKDHELLSEEDNDNEDDDEKEALPPKKRSHPVSSIVPEQHLARRTSFRIDFITLEGFKGYAEREKIGLFSPQFSW